MIDIATTNKFFSENKSSVILLSPNEQLLNFDTCNKYQIYLVNDIDCISTISLKFIYDNKNDNVVVFVNSTYNKDKFISILTNKILKHFDVNSYFHDTILYFDLNFIYKRELKLISDVSNTSLTNINCKLTNIHYIGQTGTSGYASAAKGYVADYVLNGINVSWSPLKMDSSRNDMDCYVDVLAESVINKKLDYIDKTIIHCTPDIWHKYIVDSCVGYCTWESDRLPKLWVDCINSVPEVWVPSTFNKMCFEQSGVNSIIKVVPHIWHRQCKFNKSDISIKDCFGNTISPYKFTYYCIAELNTRKGIDDLITTFNLVNSKYKNTQLVLKVHYKDYNIKNNIYCIDHIKTLTDKLGKSIFIILKNLSNREILSLHSFCDCYVSLNKGEGFGLTIFDAYKLGNKIITTGYGGSLDYLGSDYVGLVKFKIDKVCNMETFSTNYTVDQLWAYPDLEHVYQLMTMYYQQSVE